MRIWHQSMADLEALATYGGGLAAHARSVCEPETEVVVHGLPTGYWHGLSSTDLLGAPYIYNFAFSRIIEYARRAEAEGYDAFMIASFSEPFLRQIRSIVSIPVTSVGESNFLVACSYGKYQAHIANVPVVARLVADHVHEYRLNDRVIFSASIGPEMEEAKMMEIWSQPNSLIERFTALAEEGIAAGADVIIPTEGVLSELLHAHGVTRIGKAPVFDSFGVSWKYTEMLVAMRRRMALKVGREWDYVHAGEEKVARIRSNFGLPPL